MRVMEENTLITWTEVGQVENEDYYVCRLPDCRVVIQKCKARSKILYLYTSEEPCEGCAAPYGYKHCMRVTTDTATVYKDIIGRRDKVRRLLVFSTDARFNYTDDGNLGGIVSQ